jgi:DNA-binding transcriptional MerR regulator
MSQLYTTSEASEKTGIPASTIRSWLSRHAGVFQVDVHLIIDENGRKLWTEAGLEMLRSRVNASENATVNAADNDAKDLLEALLDKDAETLATEYWRRLPGRVLHRIKSMRETPTPQQRQIVQTAVTAALNAGTNHLLLPVYQPMLLEGSDAETAE